MPPSDPRAGGIQVCLASEVGRLATVTRTVAGLELAELLGLRRERIRVPRELTLSARPRLKDVRGYVTRTHAPASAVLRVRTLTTRTILVLGPVG